MKSENAFNEIITSAKMAAINNYSSELIKRRFGGLKEYNSDDLENVIKVFTQLHFWAEPNEYKPPYNVDTINDAVYGTFNISQEIGYLRTLPFVLRMVYIKQLSFAYIVHSGGMHSRFEHSMGVSHLTEVFINNLKARRCVEISDEESLACQVAGLLHDIGHGPCGHSLEPLALDIFSSSEISNFKKIDKILACEYLNCKDSPLKIALENIDVDKKLITDILCNKEKLGDNRYLGDLIDSSLDVDRLDYISRDSRHVSQQTIDGTRFINFVNVADYRDRKNSLVYQYQSQHSINNLLSVRKFLYSDIYRDPKVIAADEMICRSVYDLIEENRLNKEAKLELLKLTDSDLLFILRLFGPESSKKLVEKILQGECYEPLCTYTIDPTAKEGFEYDIYQISLRISNREGYHSKMLLEKKFLESLDNGLKKKINSDEVPKILLYIPPSPFVPMNEKATEKIKGAMTSNRIEDTLILTQDKKVKQMKELGMVQEAKYPQMNQIHIFGPRELKTFSAEVDNGFRSFVSGIPP